MFSISDICYESLCLGVFHSVPLCSFFKNGTPKAMTRPEKSLHFWFVNPVISLHFFINTKIDLHYFLILKSVYICWPDEAKMGNAEEQPIRNTSGQIA
jgi:hypothetical protein